MEKTLAFIEKHSETNMDQELINFTDKWLDKQLEEDNSVEDI